MGEKIVLLLSGGIDSPVAAYTLIRKGYTPVFIFFDNYPFADEKIKEKVVNVVKKLSDYSKNHSLKVYLVPHGKILNEFLEKCSEEAKKLTCIYCKRMMYRIAEKIAEKEGAFVIATGECLGEQASQTLNNLYVLNQSVKIPVFRPLIGWDKEEITELARKIGTYDFSIQPAMGCSLPPRYPETRAKKKKIEKFEERIDIERLIDFGLNNLIIFEVQ